MSRRKYSVGVDIGGTKTSIGIVDDNGRIVEKVSFPSSLGVDCEALVIIVSEEIKKLLKRSALNQHDMPPIGVGIPGTANMKERIAKFCPNVFWQNNEPIGEYFKKHLGIDIELIQDSRAAAVAELIYGVGRRLTDFICVAIGTGVSCGIVIDSKIFHGALDTAGELGDTVVVMNGRLCNCGNRGCLDQYASGVGIINTALERFPNHLHEKPQNAKSVFELAESGHEGALTLVSEAIEKLAMGIAAAINILSPQAVVISGGMSNNEKLVLEPLKRNVYKFAYKPWVLQNPDGLFKSELSSEAPLIGAASLHKLK